MLQEKQALGLMMFLNAVIERIPAPIGDRNQPLKSITF